MKTRNAPRVKQPSKIDWSDKIARRSYMREYMRKRRKKQLQKEQRYNQLMKKVEDAFWDKVAHSDSPQTRKLLEVRIKRR